MTRSIRLLQCSSILCIFSFIYARSSPLTCLGYNFRIIFHDMSTSFTTSKACMGLILFGTELGFSVPCSTFSFRYVFTADFATLISLRSSFNCFNSNFRKIRTDSNYILKLILYKPLFIFTGLWLSQVEHRTLNPAVEGSNPSRPAIF